MNFLKNLFLNTLPFLRELLKSSQPYLIKWLQTEATKRILKMFFKSAIPGGIKAWAIKYVVKEILFDKAITPMVQAIFLEVGYVFNVGEGQILITRRKKAVDENNQEDYDSTVIDILS